MAEHRIRRNGAGDRRIDARMRKRVQFFILYNRLIDEYAVHLGGNGVAVYAALCRYAGDKEGCNPSIGLIARRLGLSRNTVKEKIERLERLGLVTVEEQLHSNGDQDSNVYWIEPLPDEIPEGWDQGPRPVRTVFLDGEPIPRGGSTIDQGVDQPLTGGGSMIDLPPGQPLATKKTYLEEDKSEEEEDPAQIARKKNRELVAAYVRARECGYDDRELAELEARDDNPPGLPVFPWSEWVKVRDDRSVRQALAAEKRRIGATW